MEEKGKGVSFIALSTKPNTVVINEGDDVEKANKVYDFVISASKDNPLKRFFIEDNRAGIKKRITFLDGKKEGELTLTKADEKKPVNIDVLIEVFRRIDKVAIDSKILSKWKKRYYSYGFKLLIEGKFGTGYEVTTAHTFEEMMQTVEFNGGKAIDESTIEKYVPKGDFDTGWKLSQFQGNGYEHDKAKIIGGKFIELYYELKKNGSNS